jgi:glucokinase
MQYAIAIDIGGTHIKYALVGRDGAILYEQVAPTEPITGLINEVKQIVSEVLGFAVSRKLDIAGVGVGVPSIVDDGIVLFANNLPELNNQRLDELLADFRLPIYVDNDANLMGLGEARYGAAQGASDVVFLTVGTGIGGTLILNGQLYGGYRNRGTEMGHIIIDWNGNDCTCGAKGCLEAQASVTALVHSYEQQLRSRGQCVPKELNGKYIVSKYLEQQESATVAMDQHFYWLSVGIASYINVFAPQKVIVGGGITEAGDFYIRNIRKRVKTMAMKETSQFTHIEAASLGNKAGFLGAAALVFRYHPI